MPISKMIALLILALPLGLAACGHAEDYPMRNPVTGETVMCHSGVYWTNEDNEAKMLAQQCIDACSQHGFQLVPKDESEAQAMLHQSPGDLRALTPRSCM